MNEDDKADSFTTTNCSTKLLSDYNHDVFYLFIINELYMNSTCKQHSMIYAGHVARWYLYAQSQLLARLSYSKAFL